MPTGEWFTLEVAFRPQSASVRIGDGEPLVIPRLAHGAHTGFIGIWSYLPAYFSNLRVVSGVDYAPLSPKVAPSPPGLVPGSPAGARGDASGSPGLVDEWFLEGFGSVRCEPSGILNLNRYLPLTLSEARLVRRLVAERKTQLEINFGFSDVLTLALDDQVLYEGKHLYEQGTDPRKLGYVGLDYTLECTLSPGEHTLAATLSRTEFFGWGLIMALNGAAVRLEPAAIG